MSFEKQPSSISSSGELVGHVVNGLEIRKLLGEGGMGQVYLAHQLALDIPRAVKVIGNLEDSDPASRLRFRREAQVLSRLHHNHIIQVLDFGEFENGALFIAMEYIHGSDLAKTIKTKGPMGLADGLRVLMDLADALRYAHAQGVVHRDLKPANVVLRDDEPAQAKIIDFGLVKIVANEKLTKLTKQDQIIGSPLYLSPEQAQALEHLTGAVDVYALAGIAYELLSGSPVFRIEDHPSVVAMVRAHCHLAPPKLSERCPDGMIPEFLDSLLLACLAKTPEHRPSAEEIAFHFERLHAEVGVQESAQPITPTLVIPKSQAPRAPDRETEQAEAVWPPDAPPPGTRRLAQQAALVHQIEENLLELCAVLCIGPAEYPELAEQVDHIQRVQSNLADLGLEHALLASDAEDREGSLQADLQRQQILLQVRIEEFEELLRADFRALFVQVMTAEFKTLPESASTFMENIHELLRRYEKA